MIVIFKMQRYEGKNHEVLKKSLRAYKPRDICEPGQVLTNQICGKIIVLITPNFNTEWSKKWEPVIFASNYVKF